MVNKELLTKAKAMIIKNGVNNLKEFGYEDVTEENIFTDAIYSKMFKRMLESNQGEEDMIDTIIDEILTKIV